MFSALSRCPYFNGFGGSPLDFVPAPPPVTMRPLQEQLGNTLLAHVVKLHDKRQVLLLRFEDVHPEELKTLNFVPPHWTPQDPVDKPQGRCLLDPSHPDDPIYQALNTVEALEEAKAFYGDMVLPQIVAFILSWFLLASATVGLCVRITLDMENGCERRVCAV
jgi:hypothetical protein